MRLPRYFLALIWICAACAAGGNCRGQSDGVQAAAGESGAAVGRPAPDFTVTALDGQPLTLSKELRKEKHIILMFSRASW